MLIFVTGGVRSGKSSFAERLAIERGNGARLHYIATGRRDDPEMSERIMHHQKRRHASGLQWRLWEVSVNLADVEKRIEKGSVVLLDCLTTWLNNELFSDWNETFDHADTVRTMMLDAISTLQSSRTLIVVSNELVYEPITEDRTTFTYVKLLGNLHQVLVQMAEEAYLCEYGIPILMKGRG